MTIRFEIPQELEHALRQAGDDPTQIAREALLVALYRLGRVTHHQLVQALGLSRYETDGVLKRHGVFLELSPEELTAQVASLREMGGG